MNRNDIEFYNNNVPAIRRALERIANALENNNLTAEEAHNVKHAFTGMNGEQVDKIYYKSRKDMFADNPCTKEEHDAVKQESEELDTQHDYLHGLVQDLDNNAYFEFCNTHCLPASDAVAVSNYITDLDYDEVLGIIKELEEEYPFGGKSDDQANEDAIEEVDFRENHIICPDLDLRETAKMYTNELLAGNFNTKKECILDYITNEFGSHGARYTDIIKFAYYLNHANGSKFDSTRDRGYYSLGMSGRNPYLVHGGKDYLVKGINKEGNERYFALSFVESATDYWKKVV